MIINSELVNYIPTFSRIWELLREEMKINVRSATSKGKALEHLLGQRDILQTQIEHRLTFDTLMGKPVRERKVREDMKLDRKFRIADDLITWFKRRRFPTKQFDSFLKQLRPYMRHRGKSVWIAMKWEDREEAELRRLKESPEKWSKKDIVQIFRKRGKEKHWFYRTDEAIKRKLRRMK